MKVPFEWFQQRIRDLCVDRSRAVLVVLGVLWGTLSLTVVLSFSDGFRAAMTQAMNASGHNLIRMWGGMSTRPYAGHPAGRWIHILPEDADLLEKNVPGVVAASVEFISSGSAMECQGRQIIAQAHGVSASYGFLRSMEPEAGGRFLAEQDIADRRRVVFLGSTIKERLFGASPAVGRTVKLWGVPFQVVGVMRPKISLSNYEGFDVEKVFIPHTTFQAIRGWRYPSYLLVGMTSPENDETAINAIRKTLGAKYQFDPEDKTSVEVWNHIAEDRRTRGIVNGTGILTMIVGVLGLMVALIGVANVMYVLVEERRREIGVQIALGARPAMLMASFFFESIVLTLSGGVGGLIGGVMILGVYNRLPLGDTARSYLGYANVSWVVAAGMTLFLGLAGCAAGFFPARRAAALDPVTALREE